jgi:monofunctional glycosyltransferase
MAVKAAIISDRFVAGFIMSRFRNILKKIWRVTLKVIIIFFAASFLTALAYRWIPVPVTPLMLIRVAEQLTDGKEVRLKKNWQPIEKISPHLPLAVVAAEDQLFLKHWGFDTDAMERAFKNNQKGKRIKGASTISQQTAKNVFLWPGRTYFRKALEVYFTALIELLWSKERILEVYLNVIEMGEGIYGADAASEIYFRTSAEKVSAQQAALIAAILPNPRKYSAVKPTPYIQGRQQWILRQMRNLGGRLIFHPEEKQEKKKKIQKKS